MQNVREEKSCVLTRGVASRHSASTIARLEAFKLLKK
jgi:hypothetical protein